MDLTLIPFAQRESDRAFVDVSQVPRGGATGYICPSCGMPLIARRGDVKAWHFAHATRTHFESATGRCDYSFFVSVRMMSRQVIGRSLLITLPKMTGMAEVHDAYGRVRRKEYVVTDAQTIEITDAHVESAFGDILVDVLGTVSEVPFVLYFTHVGRAVPHALMQTAQEHGRCGVVVIDLSAVQEMFVARRPASQDSFLDALRAFIVSDVRSKSWLYHPRHRTARLRAESELKSALAGAQEKTGIEPSVGARIQYECVMCKVQWTNDARHRACPSCRSLLYVRELGSQS